MLKSNFVTTVTRLRLVVQNYTRAETTIPHHFRHLQWTANDVRKAQKTSFLTGKSTMCTDFVLISYRLFCYKNID